MTDSGAPLLLLGSARSGTTLLQRIMNSYDEVMIWGEHNGSLAELADSYFNLLDSESMGEFSYSQAKGNLVNLGTYKNPEQWQAWNNWFERGDLKDIYRQFLASMFRSSWGDGLKYWGFKEIRYGADDRVIDMFRSCFPGTKVLFLYRNPVNVIDSQLHAFHRTGGRLKKLRKLLKLPKIAGMALEWRRLNRELLTYHRSCPDTVIIMKYEEMVSDNKVLERALGSIGLQFGKDQRHVLDLKEGRGSAYVKDKRNQTNNRWRSLGLLPAITVFLLTRGVYSDLNRSLSPPVKRVAYGRARNMQ